MRTPTLSRRRWWQWLLPCLLAWALPLQGWAAVSKLHCQMHLARTAAHGAAPAPGWQAGHADQATPPHGHGLQDGLPHGVHHGHAHGDAHAASLPPDAAATGGELPATAQAAAHGTATGHQAHAGCASCAACCAATALPVAAVVQPPAPAVQAVPAQAVPQAAVFLTGGPLRPPRHLLA